MEYIDMHTHTINSDGDLTPEQLVDYALQKKLAGIAITDHDTINGIDQAIIYSKTIKNFLVIAGIELSTELLDEEIHILGYYIDYKSDILKNTLKKIQCYRLNRVKKIVDRLSELGIFITYDEVLNVAGKGTVGRPHIAKFLVERGYVKSINEAFTKYLNKGCVAYVPRYKLTVDKAINLIKNVGGLPVLAHPGLIVNQQMIAEVLKKGIEGIEVYHPEHSWQDKIKFLDIAQRHKLIVTAGSDFHGLSFASNRHGDLGSEKISKEYIKSVYRGY